MKLTLKNNSGENRDFISAKDGVRFEIKGHQTINVVVPDESAENWIALFKNSRIDVAKMIEEKPVEAQKTEVKSEQKPEQQKSNKPHNKGTK